MTKKASSDVSGDGIIRERIITIDEIKAAQQEERDRECDQKVASISARLKFVLQEQSPVVEKSEKEPTRENM